MKNKVTFMEIKLIVDELAVDEQINKVITEKISYKYIQIKEQLIREVKEEYGQEYNIIKALKDEVFTLREEVKVLKGIIDRKVRE